MQASSEFVELSWPITIGLISDTHLRSKARDLPAALLDAMAGVDLIFHAGDVCELWVLEQLEAIAPVWAVVGNNDSWELTKALPEERFFRAGPHTLGLLHGWSEWAERFVSAREWTVQRMLGKVDAAVYGHSHQPEILERDGLLLVNPGSPTDPRWSRRKCCGRLEVGEEIQATLIDL